MIIDLALSYHQGSIFNYNPFVPSYGQHNLHIQPKKTIL